MTDETILEFEEDISDAERPDPLPIGSYPAVIRSASLQTSKSNPDNQYVAVTFLVDPDDFPVDYPTENAPDGAMLTYRRVPYGQGRRERYQMKRFCETIKAPMGARLDLQEWVGLKANIDVDHEEYEEELRAQISRVNPS